MNSSSFLGFVLTGCVIVALVAGGYVDLNSIDLNAAREDLKARAAGLAQDGAVELGKNGLSKATEEMLDNLPEFNGKWSGGGDPTVPLNDSGASGGGRGGFGGSEEQARTEPTHPLSEACCGPNTTLPTPSAEDLARLQPAPQPTVAPELRPGTLREAIDSEPTAAPADAELDQLTARGDPAGSFETYYVQRGDTLSSIARWYDVSVEEIMAANNLTSSHIVAGQRLRIPVPWTDDGVTWSNEVPPADTSSSLVDSAANVAGSAVDAIPGGEWSNESGLSSFAPAGGNGSGGGSGGLGGGSGEPSAASQPDAEIEGSSFGGGSGSFSGTDDDSNSAPAPTAVPTMTPLPTATPAPEDGAGGGGSGGFN